MKNEERKINERRLRKTEKNQNVCGSRCKHKRRKHFFVIQGTSFQLKFVTIEVLMRRNKSSKLFPYLHHAAFCSFWLTLFTIDEIHSSIGNL